MARKKGAKCVPKHKSKTIYEMWCIGVKQCQIVAHYNMPKSTVPSMISRFKRASKTKSIKKQGRPRKLFQRGMRMLRKYLLDYCFDPLYVILGRFSAQTKITLSERTGRRYIRMLKIDS